MTSAILATENPGWGFFGTVARLEAKVEGVNRHGIGTPDWSASLGFSPLFSRG